MIVYTLVVFFSLNNSIQHPVKIEGLKDLKTCQEEGTKICNNYNNTFNGYGGDTAHSTFNCIPIEKQRRK